MINELLENLIGLEVKIQVIGLFLFFFFFSISKWNFDLFKHK